MQVQELTQDRKQSQGKPRAMQIIEKYKDLLGTRRTFESYWQSLHDYFYVEGENISTQYYPGTELDFTNLFDTTSLDASDTLASGFMNYLTPPGSKWFRLRTQNPELMNHKEVAVYLQNIEEEIYHMLNKSNFYYQVHPSYKCSGVYGTSILVAEDDFEDDARFFNMPIKQCCIVENGKGKVSEYYIEFEYTAYQAMTRFGEDKLSDDVKRELTQRKSEKKHPYILYIGERAVREFTKKTRENMPVEAIWVDRNAKKIVEEGGYHELPAMAHRFDKRSFVEWGFSPAMKALPMARMANTIAKTNLRAMMKHTDPPIAIPHRAFIMPFSGNPRAINYYKKGALEEKNIFSFGNQGNPDVGLAALEYYNQKVKTMMFNDVFLAFQQITKQMNNPEIQERINEKMTLLGPAVGRYLGEVLDPIVKRCVGILFRHGKLPEPPDDMIQDPRYEIEYVSALAQAQKRSEMGSLTSALQITGEMAQVSPDVLDKVNPDKAIQEVWEITGAPAHILRDDAEVQKIREQRAEQQAQAQEIAMAKEATGAAQQAAKASESIAKAGEM